MRRKLSLFTISCAIIALCLSLVINYTQAAGELTPKRARQLIARLAGIELPSDSVRVKSISPFSIPLGSQARASAVVVAQVETAFRFEQDANNEWRVAEIRTGNNRWEGIDLIVRAVNKEKAALARAELETIVTALESFRRERGFYVRAETEAVLIDQLNPRYLGRVIRVDPWHKPYEYEGTQDRFTLRSAGPDLKSNTSDDIVIAKD